MTRSAEQFVEKLLAADFAISSWIPLGTGQNNVAILANDEWVFRTAIHEDAAEELDAELAVLKAVHARLPVQTPNPEIVVKVEGCEWQVVGYSFIGGRSLNRQEISALDRERKMRLGRDIGRVLTTLHSTSENQVGSRPGVNLESSENWRCLASDAREYLKPRIQSKIWNKVNRKLSSVVERVSVFEYTPRLRHGDFGAGNWLFDHRDRLIGVIDFGSAGFGDPAMDIAGVISSTEPSGALIDSLGSTYQLDDDILGRAAVYQETFAIQEAILGAKSDDVLAIDAGLGDYVGS